MSTNFLVWSGVYTAVPAHLKYLDVTESALEALGISLWEKINPTVHVCKK